MNYIVMNKEIKLCEPCSHEEAQKKLNDLNMIYPNAYIVETDQQASKQGFKATGEAEIVEDVGCAGGACTL